MLDEGRDFIIDAAREEHSASTFKKVLPMIEGASREGIAGALDAMAARGIPVFNTPGANANAVKELVLAGVFIASRRTLRDTPKRSASSDSTSRSPGR